jgi:uncharacterized membrane protein
MEMSRLPSLLAAMFVAMVIAPVARAAVVVYGLSPYLVPDPQPGDIAYQAALGNTIFVNSAGTAVANPGKAVYVNDFAGWHNLGPVAALRWDAASQPIELGDLGPPSGFNLASAINEAGTIVGWATRGIDYGGAVRWDASGTAATELGRLSGFDGGAALAINDAGIIVGEAERYESTDPLFGPLGMRAVRWDPSGTPTELGNLGSHADGSAYSSATAINNAGTIIGASNKITRFDTDLGRRAVRWNAGATAPTELGNLGTRADGYAYTEAVAINDAGTIAGNAEKYDAAGNVVGRAVRWDASGTEATELGDLGGPQPGGGGGGAAAWAINDAGTIVGEAGKWDATGRYLGTVAVRWDALGTAATELGNLGITAFGESDCFVRAMNGAGTAVGGCNPPDAIAPGDFRAVYFRAEDGAAIDLNTLIDPASGWLLERALGISDTGWIVGIGLFDADGPEGQDAQLRHYLIHVPATAVILGDFNHDGTVDAADYVVWRKNPGGIYTQDDYVDWRANFGATFGSGAAGYPHRASGPGASAIPLSPAVPEPATACLVVAAALLLGYRISRKKMRSCAAFGCRCAPKDLVGRCVEIASGAQK